MVLDWREISREMGSGAGRPGKWQEFYTLFSLYKGFISFVFVCPFFLRFMRG